MGAERELEHQPKGDTLVNRKVVERKKKKQWLGTAIAFGIVVALMLGPIALYNLIPDRFDSMPGSPDCESANGEKEGRYDYLNYEFTDLGNDVDNTAHCQTLCLERADIKRACGVSWKCEYKPVICDGGKCLCQTY